MVVASPKVGHVPYLIGSLRSTDLCDQVDG